MQGMGAVLLGVVAAVALAGPAGAAESVPCGALTLPGTTCGCDARELRPLQGAVGRLQVQDRAQKIRNKPAKAWRDLEGDPIKVVRGPGGALFITDHHHGASAWMQAGHPAVLCRIGNGPAFATEAEFWTRLQAMGLVRLADAAGRPVSPSDLPGSLAAMPDDPFRTLAWQLRRNGGFCRTEATGNEFVEFRWADWMRARPELQAGSQDPLNKTTVATAAELARSEAGRGLPGWVGDQPSGVCPKEE